MMPNQQTEQPKQVEMTMAEWKKTHRDFKGITAASLVQRGAFEKGEKYDDF